MEFLILLLVLSTIFITLNIYFKKSTLQKSMQNKTGENGETSFGGFGEEPSKINNFAYYSQNDSRWGNTIYDHSNGYGKSSHPFLKDRGCGPTSMAMVATQLTGKQYLDYY
jgi:hypothetical protein